MRKATTGMWKLNFGFQQPSILSGICKYRLYSKAVWISNSSIVPAALNHGLTIILRNLFTETQLKGPVPVGGVAALMNRLGILETRLFLDHYYLVQRSWEGLVKVEMNLRKCRSAGRTFKPFLYGAMHDGNDYKNRSIRLQQFSPKTTCW